MRVNKSLSEMVKSFFHLLKNIMVKPNCVVEEAVEIAC